MVKVVSYPEGIIRHLSQKQFETLRAKGLIWWDDEVPGQWRYDDDNEEEIIGTC